MQIYVLLPLSLLAISALANTISPASIPETWSQNFNISWSTPDLPFTDSSTIFNTASIVDQKSGATGKPNQPVSKTSVTAVDGQLVLPNSNSNSSSSSSSDSKTSRDVIPFELLTRSVTDNYELIFNGTGVSSISRDAAIQGTAYLTFTFVSNSTYNVEDCLKFCDATPSCIFVNLYYEFPNDPSTANSNSYTSNLKCVLYADVHTGDEKTNWGNQTYIQQSSGWSLKSVIDPDTPQGYEYVFGPVNAANNARGYMGFVFLDRYDVSACAQECSKRGPDPVGGTCQYFNIWRAVVNGFPATYTCSLYYHPTDISTATNKGLNPLKVTLSRGYVRTNYIIDGSFEHFPPFPPSPSTSSCHFSFFCYLPSSLTWLGTSPPYGTLDATIFLYQPLAHFGITFGLLGSASQSDKLAGTLTPASPLRTIKGRRYTIEFFHMSAFASEEEEAGAFVDILWNGDVVKTIRPGWSKWRFQSVEVVGRGEDVIAFHGGSAPAWSFIDDVAVFES